MTYIRGVEGEKMGLNKRYDGYKAYGYLDQNDFKRFKMAKEIDRVKEYLIPLSEEQEARVKKLAKESIFISLHEHPTILPENLENVMEYTRIGRDHCAYEGLSQSYYDVVFDNMLDGTSTITSANGWKWDDEFDRIQHLSVNDVRAMLDEHAKCVLSDVSARLSSSLGEVEGNAYDVVFDKDGKFWINHKEVGSGEPLKQWIDGVLNVR